MLVNLTPNQKEIKRRQVVAIKYNMNILPQNDPSLMQHGTGIYQSNVAFNFSWQEFMEFEKPPTYAQLFGAFAPNHDKVQYGVADNIEQVKEYYKQEIQDPARKYIIEFTPVHQNKANKGVGGGWRWEKWGEYIGKLNPCCEHLDDEEFGDDFNNVICFHLIEII